MPSITFWNRVEPRPRSPDIGESLAAKVHDALWMLTRQWQVGEFRGEDAGSPAFVETSVLLGSLKSWSGGTADAQPLFEMGLLEDFALAEGFNPDDLSLAVELGQVFEQALREFGREGLIPRFRAAYPLTEQEPTVPDDDLETIRFLGVVAGRVTHGLKLHFAALRTAPNLPPEAAVPPADADAALAALGRLRSWIGETAGSIRLTDSPAWNPEHLEYRLQVAGVDPAGGKIRLAAYADDEARLEWFAFDVQEPAPRPAIPVSAVERVRKSAIPGNVTFRGMPRARWWAFEDGTLNMDAVTLEKRELAKLIVLDFMLVHSNDWYVVPFRTSVGKLCTIEFLVVSDIFGVRTRIERADRNVGPVGKRWTMFSHVSSATGEIDDFLLLPSTAGTSAMTSESLEDVRFVRDEMANMAWAVEHTVQNRIGEPRLAYGTADHKSVISAPSSGDAAALTYLIQTTVPNNWTPFLPVVSSPGRPDIALEQGVLLRSASRPAAPGPIGRILNPTAVAGGKYRLAEEELSRLGLRVERLTYRARATDGSTHIWIARTKRFGSGDERSGLLFDLALRPG